MSEGETIGAPYDPPPMGLDFNSLSLRQLARPGGDIQPSDLTSDGKIPAGSVIQMQVVTECGYLKSPAPELHLIEANGCEVWRVHHVCTETTMVYWLLHGKSVLVGQTVNRLPETTRYIRRCPDTEPVIIPERAGSIETYVPPVDQDPDPTQTARFRQADAEITEDGITYQIRRDVFWKLHYPLRQAGECVVVATYQLMVRTQRVTVPGGDQVGPDVISKYDPDQTQEVYYTVPGCPNEHASVPPDSGTAEGPTPTGSLPVARAAAAGLIALGGVAFGIGLSGHGNSTATTVLTRTATHVPAAQPRPTPAAVPMVVGGMVCVVGQGATSLINVELVTDATVNEAVSGSLDSVGGAPIAGSTQISNGSGTIAFTINAFGTYGPFTLTGPTGAPIALGPVAGLFPFTVTSDTQPCVSAGATIPPAPPATSTAPVPTIRTTTTVTTTSSTSVPAWSWLGTVGALLVAAGLLVTRRRTASSATEAAQVDEGDLEDSDEDPVEADREMLQIDQNGYWRQHLRIRYLKNCDSAQAALVAADEEFEAAKQALDAAERANNIAEAGRAPGSSGGPASTSYEALTAAATRQGTARINLEVAEKRLAECLETQEAAYSAYLSTLENGPDPPPEPPVPTDTSSRQYWDYYFSHRWEWGELPDPAGPDPRPQSQPPVEPPSDEPPRIEIG